jgi:hypothetical protein
MQSDSAQALKKLYELQSMPSFKVSCLIINRHFGHKEALACSHEIQFDLWHKLCHPFISLCKFSPSFLDNAFVLMEKASEHFLQTLHVKMQYVVDFSCPKLF